MKKLSFLEKNIVFLQIRKFCCKQRVENILD